MLLNCWGKGRAGKTGWELAEGGSVAFVLCLIWCGRGRVAVGTLLQPLEADTVAHRFSKQVRSLYIKFNVHYQTPDRPPHGAAIHMILLYYYVFIIICRILRL